MSAVGPPLAGVEVKISDDGPGIPAEVLPRIWDPFFTTKDVGEGTGLGLYIVRSIAKRHGGRVFAESAGEEKGATFTLELPRIQLPALSERRLFRRRRSKGRRP